MRKGGAMPRNWTGSPSRWLIVASVIALVAVGGIAYAAIPDTGGVIHGCYDSRGDLSVVDPGAGGSCATGDTALSWSQQGPQGAQGPAGRPGATPAESPPRGYSVVNDRGATLTSQGRSRGEIAGLTLPAGSYFVFAKPMCCSSPRSGPSARPGSRRDACSDRLMPLPPPISPAGSRTCSVRQRWAERSTTSL